jgi:fatty-acid desaturase
MKQQLINILRSNTSYLTPVQLLFTAAMIWAATQGFAWQWWALSIAMYFCIGCLGVSIGYHRYLSHRSFKVNPYLKWLMPLFYWFGCLSLTGSPIGWVSVHRRHHQYSDTFKDPHSPQQLGWRTLFTRYTFKFNKWEIRDLITNRYHLFLHNYYFGLLALWALALFLISPTLMLFGFVIPGALAIWASTTSNMFTHLWGYTNYKTKDTSKNLWWMALLTFGEGWHNNHHRTPTRWSFKVKWWEVDTSGAIIKLIKT